MTQKIKSFITFALSILALFSTMGASAQQNNDRRLVNVWFDSSPEFGTVVVKCKGRVLQDGDFVQNGSSLEVEACAAQRGYVLAVLKVGDTHFVDNPVVSTSVRCRVNGPTTIKAIFTGLENHSKALVYMHHNEGGGAGVFVGNKPIASGAGVAKGTILRIKATAAKSNFITSLVAQGHSLIDVPYTAEPTEVFYRVVDDFTLINVIFTRQDHVKIDDVALYRRVDGGDYGRLHLFLGDREIRVDELIPRYSTIKIKAIPKEGAWLTRLTAGRLGFLIEPVSVPVAYRYFVFEPTWIVAAFSKKEYPFFEDKGNQPRSNEGIEGANTAILSVLKDGREILIERAEPNVAVQLYNMRGEVVCQDRTNAEGYCKLVAEGVPAGAYLFNAGVVRQKVFVH